MPKTAKAPLLEDVPIWDELLAELGDPRPYEPGKIGHVSVTNEPCVDIDDWSDAFDALRQVWDEHDEYCDALMSEADDAFDDVWTWPPGLVAWVKSTEVTQQIPAVTEESLP